MPYRAASFLLLLFRTHSQTLKPSKSVVIPPCRDFPLAACFHQMRKFLLPNRASARHPVSYKPNLHSPLALVLSSQRLSLALQWRYLGSRRCLPPFKSHHYRSRNMALWAKYFQFKREDLSLHPSTREKKWRSSSINL